MAIRPLRSTLIGLLFFIAGGLALAQRPLNVPNYLLSSIPLLQPNTPVDGQLDRDDGQNFKDGAYLDIYAFDGVADEEVVLLLGKQCAENFFSFQEFQRVFMKPFQLVLNSELLWPMPPALSY